MGMEMKANNVYVLFSSEMPSAKERLQAIFTTPEKARDSLGLPGLDWSYTSLGDNRTIWTTKHGNTYYFITEFPVE